MFASILKELKFRNAVIASTNWDLELEDALRDIDLSCKLYRMSEDYQKTIGKDTIRIYKIHGDISVKESLVFTRSEWDKRKEALYTDIRSAFQNNTVLIVGHSGRDADIREIYERFRKDTGRKDLAYAISKDPALPLDYVQLLASKSNAPTTEFLEEIALQIEAPPPISDLGIEIRLDGQLKSALEELGNTASDKCVALIIGERLTGKSLAIKRVQKRHGKLCENYVVVVGHENLDEPGHYERISGILDGSDEGKYIIEISPYTLEYVLNKWYQFDERKPRNTNRLSRAKQALIGEALARLPQSVKKSKELQKLEGALKNIISVDSQQLQPLVSPKVGSRTLRHFLDNKDARLLCSHFFQILSVPTVQVKAVEESILNFASFKKEGATERQYLAPVILAGVQEYSKKGEETVGKRSILDDRILAHLSAFFGLRLFSGGIKKETIRGIPALLDGASGVVTVAFAESAGAVLLACSALLGFIWEKSDAGFRRYMEVYAEWNELPVEKRVILCEALDRKYRFNPGDSYNFLSGWLSRPENAGPDGLRRVYEFDKLDSIKAKLEELENRYGSLKDELDRNRQSLRNHAWRLKKLEQWKEVMENWKDTVTKWQVEIELWRAEIKAQVSSLQKSVLSLKKSASQVSYVCIPIREIEMSGRHELLARISSVKTKITRKDGKTISIPFVPFDEVNPPLSSEDSLFIEGLSGSGKSRVLYEGLERRIEDTDALWILGSNLENKVAERKKESGTIESVVLSIQQRAENTKKKQLVVWDNFPLGLSPDNQDPETVTKVLRNLISNLNGSSLLMTLNPHDYQKLHGISRNLTSVTTVEVKYDKNDFETLLSSFCRLYLGERDYHERLEPVISQVATLLFRRLDLPIAVHIFCETISQNHDLDPLAHARSVRDLVLKDYVTKQLNFLGEKSTERGRVRFNNLHFLFSIKLAGLLGVDTTLSYLHRMQSQIFGTQPDNPHRNIGVWFDVHNGRYSLHDFYNEVMQFDNDALDCIFQYIAEVGLATILRTALRTGRDPEEYQMLGSFLAVNSNYYSFDELLSGLEKTLSGSPLGFRLEAMSLMMKIPDYRGRFLTSYASENVEGEKLGTLINTAADGNRAAYALLTRLTERVSEHDIDSLLLMFKKRPRLKELATGLGANFPKLVIGDCMRLLEYANTDEEFAFRLGTEIGRTYLDLSQEKRNLAVRLATNRTEFARGLGRGIGVALVQFTDDFFPQQLAPISTLLGRIQAVDKAMGMGAADHLLVFWNPSMTYIEEHYMTNTQFARGAGEGMATELMRCETTFINDSTEILRRIDLYPGFGEGLWSALGFESSKISAVKALFCLELLVNSNEFVNYVWGRYSLIFRRRIAQDGWDDEPIGKLEERLLAFFPVGIFIRYFEFAKTDDSFAKILGRNCGIRFLEMGDTARELILIFAKHNSIFATALKDGLESFPHVFSSRIPGFLENYPQFSEGLGHSFGKLLFGSLFPLGMLDSQRKKLFAIAEENSGFALGLGKCVGEGIDDAADDEFEEFINVAKKNSSFGRGLGLGIKSKFADLWKAQQTRIVSLAEENPVFLDAFRG